MTITRINFTSIPVKDQDRAIGFYRDRLGFSVQLDAPYQDDWRWIFMTLEGADTRLQFARPDELTIKDGQPALTLVSDDVDAECARFRDTGVEIISGPDDAPWAQGVRWALVKDSEDNIILIESFRGA